tara:strand:- start:9265 stop:9636 length:372 start_codon:yes stop_codon:yes gene_type:complete
MSIISQLPVHAAPTNVNKSLRMDKRFGVIQVGKDLIKVDVLIQLEQVITEIQGDDEPIVEVKFDFFCEWQGEIYNCSGRAVPRQMTLPAKKWLYSAANRLDISADAVRNSAQLSKPWVDVKQP